MDLNSVLEYKSEKICVKDITNKFGDMYII